MRMLHSDHRNIGLVLFEVAIWLSVPFWGLGVLKGLLFEGSTMILILDAVSLIFAALVLLLWKKTKTPVNYLVNAFAFFWIIMFGFYWKYMEGLDGPFSYAFFTLMIFFVGVLQGKSRLILVSLLVVVNIFLTMYGELFPLTETAMNSAQLINPLAVNYVFNAIAIAYLVGYLKINFDLGRKRIQKKNSALDILNDELDDKRQTLINQKEMIIKIQNNLGLLIKDRVQEHELRNQQLQEYAYHNTHMLRGPLTNILALIELMKENGQHMNLKHAQLDEIKAHASELDEVIKKINLVLK